MTPSSLFMVLLLWIAGSAAVLAFAYRRDIARAWREPVLTAPVVIIESDDWGYGPPEQAERLTEIAGILARHRDSAGHPAVMTLGVVLAGPDTSRIAMDGCARYYRVTLADARLENVRGAMAKGEAEGVFALQLHGMEHFLPDVLFAAKQSDPALGRWLTSGTLPRTEELPARLQSRWVDAGTLPSRALPPETIKQAASEEVAAFRAILSRAPEVGVPPTFLWTSAVEEAWGQSGVGVIITPGRRYVGRDAADKPVADGTAFHNGERSASGVMYLVRDDYFEPALGHRAERGLAGIEAKSNLRRPALLEMHRANFLGDPRQRERSLAELDRLLGAACARWPSLRFMSSIELARHYRERTELIEKSLLARVHICLLRLAQVPRLLKLSWLSGIAIPCSLLLLVTRTSRTGARDL